RRATGKLAGRRASCSRLSIAFARRRWTKLLPPWRRLAAGLRLLVCAVLLRVSALALGQRKPVLPQIDLPHSYYYREMYLPQLTSGPAAVAWSPNGQWLVYAMQGFLWRQRVDGAVASVAEQLTDSDGTDHQPDWSPDGGRVVFVR